MPSVRLLDARVLSDCDFLLKLREASRNWTSAHRTGLLNTCFVQNVQKTISSGPRHALIRQVDVVPWIGQNDLVHKKVGGERRGKGRVR